MMTTFNSPSVATEPITNTIMKSAFRPSSERIMTAAAMTITRQAKGGQVTMPATMKKTMNISNGSQTGRVKRMMRAFDGGFLHKNII